VVDDLATRAESLPGGLGDRVSEWLENAQDNLPDQFPGFASDVAGGVVGLGSTLLGGILNLLTTLLVTFYLVADGPKLRRVLVSRLDPDEQAEVLGWWELAIAKTGGYVYSRALTAVVSAIFHSVAFGMIGIPYATALGMWVGVISSLIPVIGTYLAGALPLLIALADDPVAATWVLGIIVVYQQVENYLIGPRITAVTLELHPAVAFVAVLAGAALLGATGGLLALPAAAIVTALVSSYGERRELPAHQLLADVERPGGR
jgi:predicted PurR-regulated permease PerM